MFSEGQEEDCFGVEGLGAVLVHGLGWRCICGLLLESTGAWRNCDCVGGLSVSGSTLTLTTVLAVWCVPLLQDHFLKGLIVQEVLEAC